MKKKYIKASFGMDDNPAVNANSITSINTQKIQIIFFPWCDMLQKQSIWENIKPPMKRKEKILNQIFIYVMF